MNLAFYTYFFGSNNNTAFCIPEIPSYKYDCYYFTNNQAIIEILQHTNWIGIYIDIPTNDDLIESCMFGKHIKTSPHEYKELKDYDYLCFLDNKLDHINEHFVEEFIIKYFIEQKYAMLLREHWFIKNNVWNEFDASMGQRRYWLERYKYSTYINNQIQSGLEKNTPHHCACGFIIRNMKHEIINELNNTWYKHILECGIQDQISFFL